MNDFVSLRSLLFPSFTGFSKSSLIGVHFYRGISLNNNAADIDCLHWTKSKALCNKTNPSDDSWS